MNPHPDIAPLEPETPYPAESPATEEAPNIPFSLNTGDGEKPKQKKKPGLIALCVCLAAVVVAALLVIFNFGAVKGFYNRTFLSPEDYLVTVEKEALCNSVSTGYGEYISALDNTSTNINSQMHLKVSDDVLSLLESSSGMADLSWLSDIMLNVAAIQDDDLTQVDLGIGLKSTEIAAIRMITDLAGGDNGTIYLGLPGLSDQYLTGSMDLTADPSATLAYQQFSAEDLRKLLPDEDTFNKLLDRYSELVLSQIVNVKKTTKTVSCSGAQQDVTVLTSTITEEELAQILTSVLETMKQDEQIRSILENIEDVLGDMGLDAEDLYNGFRDEIDTAIEAMADADINGDNYATLVTYVDYRGSIVGRDLTYTADDDETEIFQYLSLTDGNNIGFNLVIPEADIEIEGEGTKKGDKVNATYALSVEDQKLGTLELEDVISTGDTVSGTYRIRPSSEIIEELFSGSGFPAGLIGDAFALTFEVEGTQETSELAIRLVTGGIALVSLEFSGEQLENSEVSVPSNTIDMEEMNAMYDFLASLDFDKLLSKMEEAGVPEELVSIVSYYVSAISAGSGYDY